MISHDNTIHHHHCYHHHHYRHHHYYHHHYYHHQHHHYCHHYQYHHHHYHHHDYRHNHIIIINTSSSLLHHHHHHHLCLKPFDSILFHHLSMSYCNHSYADLVLASLMTWPSLSGWLSIRSHLKQFEDEPSYGFEIHWLTDAVSLLSLTQTNNNGRLMKPCTANIRHLQIDAPGMGEVMGSCKVVPDQVHFRGFKQHYTKFLHKYI